MLDTNFSYHSTQKVPNREVFGGPWWLGLLCASVFASQAGIISEEEPGLRKYHSWHFSPLDMIPPHPTL